MEKVKITLCGSEFNLKTEDPVRLMKIAESIQVKIDDLSLKTGLRPIKDIVLLICLDLADENSDLRLKFETSENATEAAIKQASEHENALNTERNRCNELKAKSDELVSELEKTVNKLSECEAKLCEFDPELIKTLQSKLEEKESNIKKLEEDNSNLEKNYNALKDEYAKSIEKTGEKAVTEVIDAEERAELETLRKTVATYERTFEEYINQKNSEFADLNEEITRLKKKYADLNSQMSEIVNDGQMTL